VDRLAGVVRIDHLPAFVDDDAWLGYECFDLVLQFDVQVSNLFFLLSEKGVVNGLAFLAIT
jgi:hypothetical protein